jgi:hypothetical protein
MANETVICTYRARVETEAAFLNLLRRHWTTLHDLGFVSDEPSRVYRHAEEPTYVEIFDWVAGGFEKAHEHPDVLAIWEPMEPLLEERNGRPRWEFPHFAKLDLPA